MNVYAERSRSVWMGEPPPAVDQSTRDTRVDVLVIGSGIAGLSCAYELLLAGRRVTIVDRGPIARGMTARTSAHLSYAFDDYYHELIRLRGEEEARQYLLSQQAAVDRIEQICMSENIDCDFARVDGILYAARADDRSLLEAELEACQRIGFSSVHWTPFTLGHGDALRFPQQGRFHPVKYLDGLARAIAARGGVFHSNAAVIELDETTDAVRVEFEQGAPILANEVIVASNSPISSTVAIHTKQAPYRTYVVAAPVPKGHVEDALIWDTLDPYHYVRLQPRADDDLLIVGGEDHKTGTENDGDSRIAELHAWARERWPQMGAIEHAWSGQVYEPVDFAPYIGPAPGKGRVYLVTGDSGEGLTTGAAAGLILKAQIVDRERRWSDVYEPSRKTLRAGRTYVEENLDVAANMTEHIHDSEQLDSLDEVAPGSGAIVNLSGRKVAAYRNANGEFELRSATCTHVGCIVHWNSFERCWDCPCHGSQFAVTGEALTGPAMKPLAPHDDPSR